MQSNDSNEECIQRNNIGDASVSENTTDNENKHNSSEEAWTDVNLNEDGDTILNPRDDPRNIHNIAHSQGTHSLTNISNWFNFSKSLKNASDNEQGTDIWIFIFKSLFF